MCYYTKSKSKNLTTGHCRHHFNGKKDGHCQEDKR